MGIVLVSRREEIAPLKTEELDIMKNKYGDDIKYIMQGRFIGEGVYWYILVDCKLVDDARFKMTPVEADEFAKLHGIERISSGSLAIIRSEAWKDDEMPWPETK